MFQLSNSIVVILNPGVSKRLFLFIFLIIKSEILSGLSLLYQKIIFLIEYFLQFIDPLTAPKKSVQITNYYPADTEGLDNRFFRDWRWFLGWRCCWGAGWRTGRAGWSRLCWAGFDGASDEKLRKEARRYASHGCSPFRFLL